ncbi:MAG TPA: glycosyltransferase, partial [Proteobacteria bacterium]|nr:glycosyltransferase [Pseudomonadota bacterium]
MEHLLVEQEVPGQALDGSENTGPDQASRAHSRSHRAADEALDIPAPEETGAAGQMKILFVVHENPLDAPAGVQVYTRSVAEILATKGFETAVFSQRESDSDERLEELEHNGVRYFLVNSRLLSVRNKRFRFRESYDDREVFEHFKAAFDGFKPDVLHIMHLLTLSGEIALHAKEKKVPVIIGLHDYWYLCHRINLLKPDLSPCSGPDGGAKCRHCGDPKYNRFPLSLTMPIMASAFSKRTRYLRRVLNSADIIHSPSQATKRIYVENGTPEDKIELLPYGYMQIESPHKKKMPGYIRLGFVGTIAPHKGLHVLLDALWGVDPARIELQIYGEAPDRGYYESLRKKAEGMNVKFMGTFKRSELSRIYQSFDILAFPTLWSE